LDISEIQRATIKGVNRFTQLTSILIGGGLSCPTKTNIMKTKVIQIATELMELQSKGYYIVFFDFSGHVDSFYVRIYKGQWRKNKKPIFDDSFYLYRDADYKLDALLDCIEVLKAYKPGRNSKTA
jgi:hypothetical protein